MRFIETDQVREISIIDSSKIQLNNINSIQYVQIMLFFLQINK